MKLIGGNSKKNEISFFTENLISISKFNKGKIINKIKLNKSIIIQILNTVSI